MLTKHVPVRVVMETLDYSPISLTMNTHSDVIPAMPREAAELLDAVLIEVT